MVAMNNRKWRLYRSVSCGQSHQKSGVFLKYKTSLQLELWGETEVITSKGCGTEVSTSEGNGCL